MGPTLLEQGSAIHPVRLRRPREVYVRVDERQRQLCFRGHGVGDDLAKAQVLDQHLHSHLLAQVVGVVDEDGLTKPWAYVVAADVSESTLQDWVRRELEPYKYPRKVVFLDVLPRTHLGKVDRGKLRAG